MSSREVTLKSRQFAKIRYRIVWMRLKCAIRLGAYESLCITYPPNDNYASLTSTIGNETQPTPIQYRSLTYAYKIVQIRNSGAPTTRENATTTTMMMMINGPRLGRIRYGFPKLR